MAKAAIKIWICIWALSGLIATPFALTNSALNTQRIHALYQNGDFDKVIKALVAFEKSGRSCSYNDSVFLEKHLAVVYAANPATRELGRYHMHKLLDLAPAAELLDMFVGEEVDKVFEKVRKEHVLAKNEAKPKSPPVTSPPLMSAQFPKALPLSPTGLTLPSENLEAKNGDSGQANPLASSTDSLPTWKQKGVWVGGGAALAVVAFALYYSNAPTETPSKTYVVPATTTK